MLQNLMRAVGDGIRAPNARFGGGHSWPLGAATGRLDPNGLARGPERFLSSSAPARDASLWVSMRLDWYQVRERRGNGVGRSSGAAGVPLVIVFDRP
jgi:hypothetical protein